MSSDWKKHEKRQEYIAAVVAKLNAEGRTVFELADIEAILRDAFKVEAADDFRHAYCLLYKDKQIEGPMHYAEAMQRASQLSDANQCDVTVLQAFDTFYYIDY